MTVKRDEREFVVGDVVQLKSGGPLMVVTGTETWDETTDILVCYATRHTTYERALPNEAVVLMPPDAARE